VNLVEAGHATERLVAGPAYRLARTSSTPELHTASRRRAVWVRTPLPSPPVR